MASMQSLSSSELSSSDCLLRFLMHSQKITHAISSAARRGMRITAARSPGDHVSQSVITAGTRTTVAPVPVGRMVVALETVRVVIVKVLEAGGSS